MTTPSPFQQKGPKLYVVSGPSGSGKTSICRRIANERGWYYSVSHTTRPQRENEVNGQDYYFVSKQEFIDMSERGEFYEWAQVYDNLYGTSKQVIDEHIGRGQSVILDLDTQGAAHVKSIRPKSVLIFIETPGVDELKDRLQKRGRDSEDEIQKRINQAKAELSKKGQYDHVILNDNFERAVEEMNAIIDTYEEGNAE